MIERLARSHPVHIFVLRHHDEPCTYQLLGATVHDLGRAKGPAGIRSLLQVRHLLRALRQSGPFDILHGYWAVPAGVLTAIPNKTIVLTGALSPARFSDSDATFNIGMAFAAVQSLPSGVYVAMNGRVFRGDEVKKDREQRRFVATNE